MSSSGTAADAVLGETCVELATSSLAELHCCALCNKREAALGDFKRCSQCKLARYCSRECQRADYYSGHVGCVMQHLRTALQAGPLGPSQIKQALKVVDRVAGHQQHQQAAELLAAAVITPPGSTHPDAYIPWLEHGLASTVLQHISMLMPLPQPGGSGRHLAPAIAAAIDMHAALLAWLLHWLPPDDPAGLLSAILSGGHAYVLTAVGSTALQCRVQADGDGTRAGGAMGWAVNGAGCLALMGYFVEPAAWSCADGHFTRTEFVRVCASALAANGSEAAERLVQLLARGQSPGYWWQDGLSGPFGMLLVAALQNDTLGALQEELLSERLYSSELLAEVLASALRETLSVMVNGTALFFQRQEAGRRRHCGTLPRKAVSCLSILERLVAAAVPHGGWEGLRVMAQAAGGQVVEALQMVADALMRRVAAAGAAADDGKLLASALVVLTALMEAGCEASRNHLPQLLPAWLPQLHHVDTEYRQLVLALTRVMLGSSKEHGTWLDVPEIGSTGSPTAVRVLLRIHTMATQRAAAAAQCRKQISLQNPQIKAALVACLDPGQNPYTQDLAIINLAALLEDEPLCSSLLKPMYQVVASRSVDTVWPPLPASWLPTNMTTHSPRHVATVTVLRAILDALGRQGGPIPPLEEIRDVLAQMLESPPPGIVMDGPGSREYLTYAINAFLDAQILHPEAAKHAPHVTRRPLAPAHHHFLATRLIPALAAHLTPAPPCFPPLGNVPDALRYILDDLEQPLVQTHLQRQDKPNETLADVPIPLVCSQPATLYDHCTSADLCPPDTYRVVVASKLRLLQRPVLEELLRRITGFGLMQWPGDGPDAAGDRQIPALSLLAKITLHLDAAQWGALLRVPGLLEVVVGCLVERGAWGRQDALRFVMCLVPVLCGKSALAGDVDQEAVQEAAQKLVLAVPVVASASLESQGSPLEQQLVQALIQAVGSDGRAHVRQAWVVREVAGRREVWAVDWWSGASAQPEVGLLDHVPLGVLPELPPRAT